MKSARKCRRGHALTGDNVMVVEERGRVHRRCRTCYNDYMRKYMRKRRTAAKAAAAKKAASRKKSSGRSKKK